MTAFDCWVRWYPHFPPWTTCLGDEHRAGWGLSYDWAGRHWCRMRADWKVWSGVD